MIINKDGKLFGKISIVDIAVVLVIVLLAVGLAAKFGGKTSLNLSTNEKIQSTLLVRNVRMYSVEALQKGGELYDKTTKEYIGDITDVRYEAGEATVNMADGTFSVVPVEGRYNVYVTVEFTGKTSDKGYYTEANKQIGTGSTIVFNSKFAQCESTVVDVRKI